MRHRMYNAPGENAEVCPVMTHDYNDLIRLFNGLFEETEGTILLRGDNEPIYLPRDDSSPHDRVIFAHGYFSSALHEISHWCIAGKERRRLVDFGYWYRPDGRDAEEQRQFEQVEVRPQALEWLFSEAAGIRFHVSLDNLNGAESGNEQVFKQAVLQQVHSYLTKGLPPRGAQFLDALLGFYRRRDRFGPAKFELAAL